MSAVAWTWWPDWREGIVDRWRWQTAIQPSEDGSEERQRMRRSPRRVVEFTVEAVGSEKRRLESLLWRQGIDEWQMPIWWQWTRLSEDADEGDTDLFTEGLGEIDDQVYSEYALLRRRKGRRYDWELVEIDDSSAAVLELASGVDSDWPEGTRVYPCWPVEVTSEEIPQPAAGVTRAAVTAEVTAFDDPVVPTQASYRDDPILERQPNWVEGLSAQYQRVLREFDGGIGAWDRIDAAGRPFVVRGHRHTVWEEGSILSGTTGLQEFTGNLAYMYGRWRGFWCPSHSADLILAESIDNGDTSIVVEKIDVDEHFDGQLGRTDISIRKTDGDWIHRRIVDTQTDADIEKLDLDESIDEDLALSDVTKICWLEWVRMASDELVIERPAAEVIETSFSVRGLR